MELAGQVLRFGGVGMLATALHVLTALSTASLFGLTPLQANFVGFLTAALFAYPGHARLTFGRPVRQAGQFQRFLISGIASLALSSALAWGITDVLGADFALAMAVVGVTVPVFTYLVLRLWVFDDQHVTGTGDVTGIAICAGIAALVLLLLLDRQINHDTAWYLIAVREWLGGAALYTDLVEVNPPLNFYFTLPAIWLADLLSIRDGNGQYLLLSLLFFASLLWCRAIIRAGFALSPWRGLFLLLALAAAMTLPALREFGQREHILILLIMPWLLLQAAEKPASRRQEIAAAVVAGLGICLKPHFVLIPLAITLVQMGRQHALRPVFSATNLTFLTVGLTYVSFVAVVHPAYLTTIVPMARDIYGSYGAPLPTVLSRAGTAIVLLLMLCILTAATRYGRTGGQGATGASLFIAAAVAALAIYLLQGTGFRYHLIPLKSLTLAAAALLLGSARKINLVVIGVLFILLKPWIDAVRAGFYANGAASELIHMARDLGPTDSLMVFTTHVYLGPGPTLALEAQWVSRYPANWLVPGAVNRLSNTDCDAEPARCARLNGYIARNRADNIAEMRRVPPDLIVFDRQSGYFDKPDFSWPDFMAQDPAWAEIIADYRQVRVTDRAIYLRRTASL